MHSGARVLEQVCCIRVGTRHTCIVCLVRWIFVFVGISRFFSFHAQATDYVTNEILWSNRPHCVECIPLSLCATHTHTMPSTHSRCCWNFSVKVKMKRNNSSFQLHGNSIKCFWRSDINQGEKLIFHLNESRQRFLELETIALAFYLIKIGSAM